METCVTYEQAKALKSLGFNRKCSSYYLFESSLNSDIVPRKVVIEKDFNLDSLFTSIISAPSLNIVSDWMREIHGIYIHIEPVIGKRWTYELQDLLCCNADEYSRIPERDGYPVKEMYSEALSAGITEALKVLEDAK